MPFTANLMPVTSFSTNFGPQQADKGDTDRVPLVGAPSGSSDFPRRPQHGEGGGVKTGFEQKETKANKAS
jgi:hypothetical protein